MRKTVLTVTFSALMFSASAWAQKIAPRCSTCGRKIIECQYKGHHPSKSNNKSRNNGKPTKMRPRQHGGNASTAPKAVKFPDGIYTGDLKNGVRDGSGTFKYSNGDIYSGSWHNNKRQSYGPCTFSNGDVYEGYWSDDTFETGTLTYANGDKYKGEWKDGKRNGRGKYSKADGSSYNGDYKDGKRDGGGYQIFAGDTIAGEFKNDMLNGYSYKRTKNGNRVMGMYKDGVANGFSIIVEHNGTASYLYMKECKAEGPAITVKPDDTICSMLYSNGKVIRSDVSKRPLGMNIYYGLGADLSFIRTKQTGTTLGIIVNHDGMIYIGDLRKNQPNGFGTMIYSNKDAYIGFFVDGCREGQGAYVFNNRCCEYGQWLNNKENGLMTYVRRWNGMTEQNMYKNGEKVQ